MEFRLVSGEPGGDYLAAVGLVADGAGGATSKELGRGRAETTRQIRDFARFQARTIGTTMPR
jgi:hypothetical protein